MSKKFYISGKITGLKHTEAEALFNAAEKELLGKGLMPVNPMKLNHNHNGTWQNYMREDVKALCDCDGIYMLANWRDSNGAPIELQIANHLELEVMFQHRLLEDMQRMNAAELKSEPKPYAQ